MASIENARVLLLTNHMYEWGGSEMIITELAEEFRKLGAYITIFANHVDDGFIANLEGVGTNVETDSSKITLTDYKFVYCQHQVLTVFLNQLLTVDRKQLPIFVYSHLSPFAKLEFPGPLIESRFGRIFLCNSRETIRKMRDLGLENKRLLLMPNPAPDGFFGIPARDSGLRNVLVVTNHLPSEIKRCIKLLQSSGVKVSLYGRHGTYERVTPAVVAAHDAVVAIGKTVQYSLAATRPTYVYDHFGGPGWISEENFELSAEYNFSGRCTNRRLNPHEIFYEITTGFDEAREETAKCKPLFQQFRLSTWLDAYLFPILEQEWRLEDDKCQRIESAGLGLWREQAWYLEAIENRRVAIEQARNSLCARLIASLSRFLPLGLIQSRGR